MKCASKLSLGFFIPLLLVGMLSGVSYFSLLSLQGLAESDSGTANVITQAGKIDACAVAMESAMHQFLLSGDERFFESYQEAGQQFKDLLADWQKEASESQTQGQRLGKLGDIIKRWERQVVEPSIAIRKQVDDAATFRDLSDLVVAAKGHRFSDRIRAQIGAFVTWELSALEERRIAAEEASEIEVAETTSWVEQTHALTSKANELSLVAVGMESEFQGYLVAGDQSFLASCDRLEERFQTILNDLQADVADRPEQQYRLTQVSECFVDWHAKIQPALSLRDVIDSSTTMDDLATSIDQLHGQRLLNEFREQLDGLVANEVELSASRENEIIAMAGLARNIVLFSTVIIFALTIGIAYVLIRNTTAPIATAASKFQLVAAGDLTQQLETERNDEWGVLAESFNAVVANLRGVIGNLHQDANRLNRTSGEISGLAQELASKTEDANQRSTTVAAAAEQMSSNMNAMAQSSERVSLNVNGVANSIGEMTSSIAEVAQNAESAASIAGDASQLAEASNDRIQELGTAANEIGNVIDVIQDIAEQTNLLALNATIEAARAGEAGKGFAVVAGEVKELARQTAAATDDIRVRIQGIQRSTGDAIDSVGEIGKIIGQINETSRSIASAVEQQNSTTKQIAASVSETAAASEVVSRSVNESANASQEITQNITAVSDVLERTIAEVQRSKESGDEFAQLAQQMEAAFARLSVASGTRPKCGSTLAG